MQAVWYEKYGGGAADLKVSFISYLYFSFSFIFLN